MDDIRRELDRLTLVSGVSVRKAGLLNCCLTMLREAYRGTNQEPGEGDIRECPDCGEHVIYRDAAWRWFPNEQ